jgi:aspartate dehydrogenase
MDVGIVGVGTIGRKVATELDKGTVPGVKVTAFNSRDVAKAETFAATLSFPPRVVSLEELPSLCDLVIETAGANTVSNIVKTALEADTSVMVLSCGALLDREDLLEMARLHGVKIHVPSGAIIGMDGLLAASMGRLDSVTMITRKPPGGLKGSPGATRSGVDLDAITEATELFDGPVMEGFSLFPANVNVSAAVSMAGIGPHKTRLKVIADPAVTRNTHDIVAEGEFGLMRFQIENVPSKENPRTGRLTALSVLAYLKQLTSPLHLGV